MQSANLKNAYLRCSCETYEQLEALVKTPSVELIYVDAAFFDADSFRETVAAIHRGKGGIGKKAVLRFPHVFRTDGRKYFDGIKEKISAAGFDGFLLRSIEEVLWLKGSGIEGPVILDHTVYNFNSYTDDEIRLLTGLEDFESAYSPELNSREIKAQGEKRELVVYGRAPLMVSAQCIRRTSLRCDKRESVMYLKDRTGAMMPVKNVCRFCYNEILNAVPTCIFDLEDEITKIAPSSVRYEFTTENADEVSGILGGKMPGNFTRGHFHRGVE